MGARWMCFKTTFKLSFSHFLILVYHMYIYTVTPIYRNEKMMDDSNGEWWNFNFNNLYFRSPLVYGLFETPTPHNVVMVLLQSFIISASMAVRFLDTYAIVIYTAIHRFANNHFVFVPENDNEADTLVIINKILRHPVILGE